MTRHLSIAVVNAALFTLLAVTVAPVARDSYGEAIISQLLFAVAAVTTWGVLIWPGNRILRPLSGACVGFAFAWRATSVFVTWLQGGNRFLYGAVLYLGLAAVFTIGWADMLPTRPKTREAIARLRREGDS